MRRSILAAFTVPALAVALIGCNSEEPGASDDPSDELSGDLVYAIWGEAQAPAMQQMADDFSAANPGVSITVEVTPFAQYWTKLETQATGNTLPDVFWMNGPNAQVYAPNGLLEPVTSLVESGAVDPSNYPEVLNELYTIDGVQYGVPKDFDTIGVWYNKDILARAGVAEPSPDWTWADFQSAAKAVSDALEDEGIFGVVAELAAGGQQSYYDTVFQAGGWVISDDRTKSGFDDPKSIRGLEFWADLIAEGASPTMEQLSDTTPNQWFTSGKAAMYWAGSWMVAEIAESGVAEHVSTVQMPADERSATVLHGLSNVVAADGTNKDAAMAFAAYLGSEEAAITQAQLGAAIPAFNGTQQEWVDSAPTFGLQMFLDAAVDYPVADPNSLNTDAWREIERELLPQAFSGQRPVAEVAEELASRMNELLAAER